MSNAAAVLPLSPVDRFIRTLDHLERTRNIEEMVELFADECELGNVAIVPLRGKPGAVRFWQDYLSFFQAVHTDFKRVTVSGNLSFLEWASEGRLQSGTPLVYEGLTVLEIRDGQIARLKAYHDSAAFLTRGGKHLDKVDSFPKDQLETRTEGVPLTTNEVMEGGPRKEISTPGEGVLTSTINDRDTATD